jgi:hypothetical protein
MSVFEEEITLNQYYQNNDRSNFLGGCYTYDWMFEGLNETTDTFRMIFESMDPGDVMIKKAILIGKNGRQLPFKRVVNDANRVIYRGTLPLEQRAGARVRYWRPRPKHGLVNKDNTVIANTIKVTERWVVEQD